MKLNLPLPLLLTLLIQPCSFLLAQGSLTPPGAPAPTMKTLDQVEARTPISAPTIITAAGSYYLTRNLAVTSGTGVRIDVDDVTLDLNGFTISSTASPAAGIGVQINGVLKNIAIKNGSIRGTTTFAAGAFTTGGFLDGISNVNINSVNLRVSDIHVLGVGDDGIDLAARNVPTYRIERCTVSICGGTGLQAAQVRDCAATTTGSTAILADIATHCSGETVDASGSFGVAALIAEHCRGAAIAGTGLVGTHVSNSTGVSTSGVGLSAALAHNCEGTSTSGSFGLDVGTAGVASFCRGRRDGGVALRAFNAIGCTVLGTGTATATNKTLGTP